MKLVSKIILLLTVKIASTVLLVNSEIEASNQNIDKYEDVYIQSDNLNVLNQTNFTLDLRKENGTLYFLINFNKPKWENATVEIQQIDCEGEYDKYTYKNAKENTKFLFPKPPSSFHSIHPNCNYNINLTWNDNTFEKHDFTIQCFEIFCDCGKGPKIQKHYLKEIDSSSYNYSWIFDENGKNNITEIQVKYSFSPSDTFLQDFHKNYFILNEIDKSKLDGAYALFFNNYSCFSQVFITNEDIVPAPPQTKEQSLFIISALLLVVAIILVYVLYNSKSFVKPFCQLVFGNRMGTQTSASYEMEIVQSINLNIEQFPAWEPVPNYESFTFEIKRSDLQIIRVLGEGQFGIVKQALLKWGEKNVFVAVKQLNDESLGRNEFLKEIELNKKIGSHPHIVEMIGCCTDIFPYLIILEYIPNGDLHHYLKDIKKGIELHAESCSYICPNTPSTPSTTGTTRTRFISNTDTESTYLSATNTPLLDEEFNFNEMALSHKTMTKFAIQIADGMAYLESKAIVHRDLATRNILIDKTKEHLKISDFGMSRYSTQQNPYFLTNKNTMLPIRWMALEALTEYKFDSKSDVWSYGVVLWEMGSLGELPYNNIFRTDVDILWQLITFLKQNLRLSKPVACSDEMYKLMEDTWLYPPDKRPSFSEILSRLKNKSENILYHPYIHFDN